MTRILIVDDHEVVRRGVRNLLASQPGFDVCGEAVDGRDGVQKAQELKPDVIVMDVSMPHLNGLEATRLIRRQLPETEIVILSQHDAAEMIREALSAGARGYVTKSAIGENIATAVATVSRHESFVPEGHGLAIDIDVQEVLQRSTALEQALRESEERFRATFEQAAIGIAHVAPDGRWLRVNRKLCEVTGYTPEELVRMTFQDITHPDDLADDEAGAARVASGELDHYSIEKRYIRKDGSLAWVDLTVAGVRDLAGNLKYFISVIQDIHERKIAQQERRQAQGAKYHLSAIVDSSDDVIVSKDLNGVIQSWNPAAERLFGYSAAEAIGQPITLIIPAELRDEEKQILARIRRGERIEHYETVRVTKSGKRLDAWLTISPIRDASGNVIGASKILRDVTNWKMTQRLLREKEELLHAAFTQTYSYLWLLALDGTILEANRAALEGTDYQRREVVGRKIWDIWWGKLPEEQKALKRSLATAVSGLAVREECSYMLRDGSVRYADRTLNPVQHENGEVVVIVASALDITEQRITRSLLEDRVKERTRELEHKNLELVRQTDVVRELSGRLLQIQDEERRRIARELHDSIGQMLAAVSMNTAHARRDTSALSSTAAKALAENAALLDDISSEIRTISHLLHPPLLDEVGLESALQWYIDGFSERSKIQVTLELPEDFGRLTRELELALFRVVQECLTNIHRHSGSRTAAIRVSRSTDAVRLQVQDEGKGIPEDTHLTINSGRLPGVGLRGMRERLRQLGGHLDVQSNAHGTLIIAQLPLTEFTPKEAVASARSAS